MNFKKMMKNEKGVNLIELMVILVLGSLGIFAVSTIITESYREWKRSNEVAALQADFDLASHMIKSILEEATNVEILSNSHIKVENQSTSWIQEFYQDSSNLIWENAKTAETQTVINSLRTIDFEADETNNNLINVYLEVEKGTKLISGSFSVFMRNS